MLASERGTGRASGATENDSPTAWPGVGYGSWPTISTRTSSKGRVNAGSTFGPAGGYRRPAASSARKNSPICVITGSTGASARAHPASTISDNGFPVTWVLPLATPTWARHASLGRAVAIGPAPRPPVLPPVGLRRAPLRRRPRGQALVVPVDDGPARGVGFAVLGQVLGQLVHDEVVAADGTDAVRSASHQLRDH